MDIKSEVEVSIIEYISSSNVDGAIDNKVVCKVEEDEVEELESNCNSEDKNEGIVAILEGEEHPNEVTFSVEDSEDEITVEEIDTSNRRNRGMAATRKNANAIALEESKQKNDLNDNRFYGRHHGRSNRPFKRINYNETTDSHGEESIRGKMQSLKRAREDDFFIAEDDIKDAKWKTKVGVVLWYRTYTIVHSLYGP